MPTQVYSNIYKKEIPLPKNPLKTVNSYIITSPERNLIIDTGFNIKECKKAFMEGIQALGIDLTKTDLFVTHLHSDHSGLSAELENQGVRVYAGKVDGKMINDMTTAAYWDNFNKYKNMFHLDLDNVSVDDNPGYKYALKEPVKFTPVTEGDVINIGKYSFKVVDIPGHTPGHMGLYEKKHKIFFCGDHILDKITPNIAFWGFERDILDVYLNSLKKVYEYDIDFLFTAHRNIIIDHKRRINELLDHHDHRLNEVKEIIKNTKRTVRDTAANMHWELRYDKWKDFPKAQKWFASAEAASHLEHLACIGEAEKTNENGILYYKLKGN